MGLGRRAGFAVGAILLAGLGAGGARADAPPPAAPAAAAPPTRPEPPDATPCAGPEIARAPDPRCGETLDGRPARVAPMTLPRAALAVPRLGARVLFWPLVKASDFAEEHKLVDWMDALLTTDDGLVGVRPQLQYSTGFVSTAGLRFFDRRLPLPGAELTARAISGGPAAILGEASLAGPAWLGLSLHAIWDRRRDRLFAGLGPQTEHELESRGQSIARYGSDNGYLGLRWSRDLPAWLTIDLHTDVTWRDYTARDVRGGPSIAGFYGLGAVPCAQRGLPDDCVDPAILPRFDDGLRILHGGAGLAFDGFADARDGGGFRIEADVAVGQGIAGDPSRDLKVSGQIVTGVGGHDRALLLRLRAGMVESLRDGAPVPFDELVAPAGALGMRAFPDGRFRGPSGGVATLEYRWFVAYNLDATLFADAGTVAGPRFSGLSLDHVFPDFGIGFRRSYPEARYWQASAAGGLQVAWAPQAGWRLLLSIAAF